MCTIFSDLFVLFYTGSTLDWFKPDFSGLVSSRVEIMVEVCLQNFLTFISRDVKMAKKSKKSKQTKSLAFNHWSLGCKTRERSKLVKTKPTIISRIFTKSPQYFTKNGINSNMDAIFRSMKITNERLDENGRIFVDQSELRIFYSYLEILSHFRWQ